LRLEKKEKLILAGFGFYGDPFTCNTDWTEENEIGRLWKRMMCYIQKSEDSISKLKKNRKWFELWIENEESRKKGFFDIFVGAQIKSIENIPYDLQIRIIPDAEYAVFTAKGNQISSDWAYEQFKIWLKKSERKSIHRFSIQVYDERFKGLDKLEESELDFYFPIGHE